MFATQIAERRVIALMYKFLVQTDKEMFYNSVQKWVKGENRVHRKSIRPHS